MVDSPFRPELFTDPMNYEETPLRDRKSDMYGLKPSGMDNRKKAELVRDVIAMANTACWRRRPAYLLMGLNDGDGSVCGLAEHLNAFGYGEKPDIKIWEDGVRKKFREVINNHIQPRLQWELKHGEIRVNTEEGKGQAKPVAYLVLYPDNLKMPYRVKKQIKGEIFVDQCWIREGASKGEFDRSEFSMQSWSKYIDVPHPLPSDWERYFERLLSDNLLRDAQEIEYYIELRTDNNNSLQNECEQFLADQNAQLLVIQGGAGSGKSTFIQRLTSQLAEEGSDAVADIIYNEAFAPPPGWIPHYFSLRGRTGIETVDELTRRLVESINQYGKFWTEPPKKPEGLFEQKSLHWLICLDGLDELGDIKAQQNFADQLRSLLSRHPRMKVLLTSRHHAISVDWKLRTATQVVGVQPLTERDIQGFVKVQLELDRGEEVLGFLHSHTDMWRLCSYPSYLAAAMRKLGRGDEPRPQDDPNVQRIFETETPVPEEQATNDTEQDARMPTATIVPILSEPITDKTEQLEEHEEENNDRDDRDSDNDVYANFALGALLDSIYEYLWERELKRYEKLKEETDEYWERTGELALETDGGQPRFMRRTANKYLKSEQIRYWLLGLGVLVKVSGSLYSFFTELTKAYFAATYVHTLLQAQEVETPDEALERCQTEFKEQVCNIIQDLS